MNCLGYRLPVAATAALFVLGASLGWAADPEIPAPLDRLDIDRGICVVIGEDSLTLAAKLARTGRFLVHVQLADPAQVAVGRQQAARAGFDATRLQIDAAAPERILLADNLANAIVLLGAAADQVPQAEVLRALRPGGKALLGDQVVVKPVPDGVDDWTHPCHGPDNNTQSRDRLATAPYLTQFLANPRYAPAPQVTVSAAGRVFKIYGNVAWHEREEPYLNRVVAHDGYNGTPLWTYQLPEGMMVHRNTFIATPEYLYIGDDQSCKLLDATTGRIAREIRPPADLAGGTFWKWMALQDGVLYALIGEAEPNDGLVRWKRTAHGWPWTEISRGFNQPENPWGFARTLLAIDPETGRVLWRHQEAEPIDGRAVCLNSSRLFAFRFGSYLTCLDAKTGAELWRKTKVDDRALFETLGPYLPRQSWETNWRTVVYLKCTNDALYFAGPQLSRLVAVSAGTGDLLWQNAYDNFQLILRPEAVYAISGPWGNNVSRKFQPLTGEVLAELPTGRRACTRPVATADSILYRAMGGSIRFDLDSAEPRWVSPMRPGCHDGVTIANGLLYWWPYVCDCQLTINGAVCLGPAGDFEFRPDWRSGDRLQTLASSDTITALDPDARDWPTFRANPQATAVSRASVPARTRILWQTKLTGPGTVRPTAPTAAGDLVFVAGDDGAVQAVDARSGTVRWTARTGGEIRIPPTIWKGRALVGSGDGWVYAYEATSGRALWRFRAAPSERKIPVFGKLLSTWPAASGVLVDDSQTAYVAAGLLNYDGTYVYGLDPATGQPRWCNDTSGHLDSMANTGVSVQGHLLRHGDRLYLAGGNAVSPAVYDATTGQCLNDPTELARCESTAPRGWELALVGDQVVSYGMPFYADPSLPVYDHTVTRKILHAPTDKLDIVWLDNAVLAAFPKLPTAELNQCVSQEKTPRHITQAWGTLKVSAKPLWGVRRPETQALAVAANAVVLADVHQVIALDLETGQPLWHHDLPAAAVPWGLAIDRRGRVIVTLVNGALLGIGDGGPGAP